MLRPTRRGAIRRRKAMKTKMETALRKAARAVWARKARGAR
jgi:hypothetical protein